MRPSEYHEWVIRCATNRIGGVSGLSFHDFLNDVARSPLHPLLRHERTNDINVKFADNAERYVVFPRCVDPVVHQSNVALEKTKFLHYPKLYKISIVLLKIICFGRYQICQFKRTFVWHEALTTFGRLSLRLASSKHSSSQYPNTTRKSCADFVFTTSFGGSDGRRVANHRFYESR